MLAVWLNSCLTPRTSIFGGSHQAKRLKISHCYILRDKGLRRKMNGDDGANGMAKNFDTNLEDGDEDEDDHYKADDDNEAWDDSQLRRWL